MVYVVFLSSKVDNLSYTTFETKKQNRRTNNSKAIDIDKKRTKEKKPKRKNL